MTNDLATEEVIQSRGIFIINENIYYIFDNSKQLCYNAIKNKSKHASLSSNRTSFGISLLLYLPSNATEHPLCRFDEEPGLRQWCSASAETTQPEQKTAITR